ncbi:MULTISPECIES: hypothetical protein [unclassified Streptomyces]|uniref:hypothetical protein n=1 Tax=unclassified Streptomyces TaxID=2593676 RepID=UPI000A9364BC|nr:MULTISPECIES: hypothetical protein [unclassified Streptomyces]
MSEQTTNEATEPAPEATAKVTDTTATEALTEKAETPEATVETSETSETAETVEVTEAAEAAEAAEAPKVVGATETVEAVEAVETAAASQAPEAVPAPPKDRRKLFAVLRWTAAVVVFATVGAGVAYGITQPDRTDIPGLSTEDDGRWTFPTLSQPALPAGAPVPQGPDNKDGTHYAQLDGLLLPAPVGSKVDDAVKVDKDGKVSPDTFLEEYTPESREKLKQSLEWDGLRQIAGRGWTTADGTRTHVYLLRFHSSGFVDAFKGCDSNAQLNGVSALDLDDVWSKAKNTQMNSTTLDFPGAANFDGTDLSVYQEVKPFLGEEQSKIGCLRTGDVLGMVIQTRKGEVAPLPFHQTVILQSQLLS